jgi:hypothetical protein
MFISLLLIEQTVALLLSLSGPSLKASKESGRCIQLNDRTNVNRRSPSTLLLPLVVIAIVIAVVAIVITVDGAVGIILDLVVVPIAHIEASSVPMSVWLADRNSDAANSDIDVFRDDNWFVADV